MAKAAGEITLLQVMKVLKEEKVRPKIFSK
jgi:hypothetical protein